MSAPDHIIIFPGPKPTIYTRIYYYYDRRHYIVQLLARGTKTV